MTNGGLIVRLLICAGGTGGGVYPALAVHSALTSQHPNVETLWVGGEGGMEEELVNRAGISYRSIPAAGVHGVGLRALPGNIAKLTRGVMASRRILREFKPDVLFFTGGFVAAPLAWAGRYAYKAHPACHWRKQRRAFAQHGSFEASHRIT